MSTPVRCRVRLVRAVQRTRVGLRRSAHPTRAGVLSRSQKHPLGFSKPAPVCVVGVALQVCQVRQRGVSEGAVRGAGHSQRGQLRHEVCGLARGSGVGYGEQPRVRVLGLTRSLLCLRRSALPPSTFNGVNGSTYAWSGGEGFIADYNYDGFDVGSPTLYRWGLCARRTRDFHCVFFCWSGGHVRVCGHPSLG